MTEEKPTIGDCFVKAVEIWGSALDLLILTEKLRLKMEKENE